MSSLWTWRRSGVAALLATALAVPAAAPLAADPAATPADSYIILKMGQPTARIEIFEKSHRWPARYFTLHGDADGLAVQKVDGGSVYFIRAVQTRFTEHSIFGSRFRLPDEGVVLATRPGAATYFGDAVVFPSGGAGPPVTLTVRHADVEDVTALVRAHHPEVAGPLLTPCDADSPSPTAADCR